MKKIFSVILFVIIIFNCAACSAKVSVSEITTTEIFSETAAELSSVLSSSEETTVTESQTTVPDISVTAETSEMTTLPTTTGAAVQTTVITSEPVITTAAPVVTQPAVTEKQTVPQVTGTTAPATEKPTEKVTKNDNIVTCSFEISCKNILANKSKLKDNKAAFVPADGVILRTTEMQLPKGSTALDVIKKACEQGVCSDNCKYCKKNGIHLDYVYTPGYDSYYIRGIHQLYEKDCGTMSGWMYSVNGVFPNYGCSQYEVKDGDVIKFLYTCDLGEDLGADI